MNKKKNLLKIFTEVIFLLVLASILPDIGMASLSEKTISGKEWATKLGLDWGPKYWPTKPVNGGTYRTGVPMYIGLMNPNHCPCLSY
jgi:hypothetical protein